MLSRGGMQNSGILSGVSTLGKAAAPRRAFSSRCWLGGRPRKEARGRFPLPCDALILSKNHITAPRREVRKGEEPRKQIYLAGFTSFIFISITGFNATAICFIFLPISVVVDAFLCF